MNNLISVFIPIALTVILTLLFFVLQKRLLPDVKTSFGLLSFFFGAVCVMPCFICQNVFMWFGFGEIESFKQLFIFSILSAVITETPKLLLLRILLLKTDHSKRITTFIVMSVPFLLGFTAASLLHLLVYPAAGGEFIVKGYALVAFNLSIGVVMGFFMGQQKEGKRSFIYLFIGMVVVFVLHGFMQFVVFLKEVDLAVIFGLDLILVNALLIHLSVQRRAPVNYFFDSEVSN